MPENRGQVGRRLCELGQQVGNGAASVVASGELLGRPPGRQLQDVVAGAGQVADILDRLVIEGRVVVGWGDGGDEGVELRSVAVGLLLRLAALLLDERPDNAALYLLDRSSERDAAVPHALEEFGVRLLDALRLPDGVAARAGCLRSPDVRAALVLGRVVTSGHFVRARPKCCP